MPTLSVVLPAYNEEATVGEILQEVYDVLQKLHLDHEIILVNDGSTDRTGEIAHAMTHHIPTLCVIDLPLHPNPHYGKVLRSGFEAASGDLIAFFPTDRQFVFAEIDRLLQPLAGPNGADIVSGYRARRQDHFIRRLNAFGWNTVVRLLFGYLCRDIDCGFKVFRRSILERVHLVSEGAMIDTELLAGAKARGYRIAEVAVTHLPRKAGSATGANLTVIARAFRDLARFRLRLSRELRQERKASRR